MLLQILTHTPVFVWALLAGLIALGVTQSRDRRVAPARLLALPALMLGLGAWSLAPGMAALALFSAGTGDPGSRRHNLNPCLNTHRPPP